MSSMSNICNGETGNYQEIFEKKDFEKLPHVKHFLNNLV